jgi:cellobiose phosphorylase
MYRLVVESLLGLNREADRLRVEPCLHPEWDGFAVRYRYGESLYNIAVSRSRFAADAYPEAMAVTVDGILQLSNFVQLVDDGNEHSVDVRVAAGPKGNGDVLEQRVTD